MAIGQRDKNHVARDADDQRLPKAAQRAQEARSYGCLRGSLPETS